MTRNRELIGASLAVALMTIVVTWPQALHMSGQYVNHQDPEFSIWRLGWIAHALARDPRHLFAANIFYPSPNPLTYSDAVLLEGVLAAPLFWVRLPPILIYNLILFVGIAGSGLAMYVLARELTGARTPALFAAAVFTMAPYRVEHIMHLEMQWAMWIPLTFWALHRTLARNANAWRYGLLAGAFVWLQMLSCVYYGVFLAIAVATFMVVECALSWRRATAALPALVAGGALAVALTAPYLWFYLRTARTMGPRDMSEIAAYSATYRSYFSTSPQNWLRGWSAGSPELNLFLGWNAMTLALIGLFLYRARLQRATYAAIAVVSVTLSFGLNTPIYGWLVSLVPTLQGLRAPARFSIVACCAAAMLTAFGAQALQERLSSRGVRRTATILGVLFVFVVAEYTNRALPLTNRAGLGTASVYQAMKAVGPGVLVELPTAHASALPGPDTLYELWSLSHWQPLVNGYSGYYPPEYIETLARMETFPDDDSVSRLERLNVRYLIVHCALYPATGASAGCAPSMLVAIGGRREIRSHGQYADPIGGVAYLFELSP